MPNEDNLMINNMENSTYFIKELRELYDKRKGKITAIEKERLQKKYDIDATEFDMILQELMIYKPMPESSKSPQLIPIAVVSFVAVLFVFFGFLIFKNIQKIKNEIKPTVAQSSDKEFSSQGNMDSQNAISNDTEKIQTIQPTQENTLNPQETYNSLVKEALEAYDNDKLEKALEKVTYAAILKSEFNIKNSPDAEMLYSKAYNNGDILLELNDKSVMPLAKRHFQIAQQIEKSSGINQKISRCK